MTRIFLAIFFVLFLASWSVHGQEESNTWDRYKPSKLNIISNREKKSAADLNNNKIANVYSADDFASRVRVIYTGRSREIVPYKKEFISNWLKSRQEDMKYADLFKKEMLFVEDGIDFWIPVQEQVIPYFEKEIKRKEQIILFTIYLGMTKNEKNFDPIFVVNDFNKITE